MNIEDKHRMKKQFGISPCLKKLKCSGIHLDASLHVIPLEVPAPKIKAIAFVRTNILNNSHPKQRLAMKGYKYFTSLSACGEFTYEKLENMRKSKSIKLIKHFEFDSYFTKHSNIKPLTRIFNKLNSATSLNFVLRRVEKMNESNLIAPFLYRIPRLKRFRVEFPGTDNIDAKGIKVLCTSITKCVLLNYLETSFIFLPLVSAKGFHPLFKMVGRLQHLQELYVNKKVMDLKVKSKEEENIQPPKSFPRIPTLKTYMLKKGCKTGWVDVMAYEKEYLAQYLETMLAAENLLNFGMKFDKHGISIEVLVALTNILPRFQHLETVTLEFLGCKLGELEMTIIMGAFLRCKQIKQFTLKLIQHPNFSEEHIIEFANAISTMKNIEKFDVYLRGTSIDRSQDLAAQLSKIDNIGHTFTQRSVHLYRIPQSEELEY